MSRATDWIIAGSNVVVALGVGFAALTYFEQQRSARLERTMEYLKPTYAENKIADEQRKAFILAFEGRIHVPMLDRLSPEDARKFLEVAAKPSEDAIYKNWDSARKHLNDLEPLAFSYYYGLTDRKIIAANACVSMTKSYIYFKELIDLFGKVYGPRQSWQVIKDVVEHMNRHYPEECAQSLAIPIDIAPGYRQAFW